MNRKPGDMESLHNAIEDCVLRDYDAYLVPEEGLHYLYLYCIVNLTTYSSEAVPEGHVVLIPRQSAEYQTARLRSGLIPYDRLDYKRHEGLIKHCANVIHRRAMQGEPTP